MREKWRAGWRAPQKRPRPLLPPPRQPPLLPGQNRLTCPCQAQNAKNSSEKGRARSTRGAGGRQTLPTPWPIGAALAQAPDRSRRRPGAVMHCRTVDFLKRHDVEAPVRRDDQDQEDGDDAPTRGYPVVPVAPRSALPIARASDGHQRRRKGDRHFEFDLT